MSLWKQAIHEFFEQTNKDYTFIVDVQQIKQITEMGLDNADYGNSGVADG